MFEFIQNLTSPFKNHDYVTHKDVLLDLENNIYVYIYILQQYCSSLLYCFVTHVNFYLKAASAI